MSLVPASLKCDRCHKTVTDETASSWAHYDEIGEQTDIDLCPMCEAGLIHYITTKPRPRKPKAEA